MQAPYLTSRAELSHHLSPGQPGLAGGRSSVPKVVASQSQSPRVLLLSFSTRPERPGRGPSEEGPPSSAQAIFHPLKPANPQTSRGAPPSPGCPAGLWTHEQPQRLIILNYLDFNKQEWLTDTCTQFSYVQTIFLDDFSVVLPGLGMSLPFVSPWYHSSADSLPNS